MLVALPPAMLAALMSGNAQALSVFIAEALQPQAANLGGDPGYLAGHRHRQPCNRS
jgi:hypothetical protein